MHFTDQLGRVLTLDHWPPRRIISLVPSQTELLAYLGLDQEVLGITKFCIHPAKWFQEKQRVGGTKTLDFQKIAALEPDLIIGNKEENEQAQMEQLMQQFPVWMSDITTLEQALDMMRSIGALTGKAAAGNALATEVQQKFGRIGTSALRPIKTAYFIWRKPYLVAANDTFIDDMLQRAGFENVFGQRSRYPEIQNAQLQAADPELILLSSEPYPFTEKHKAALQELCPKATILLVDGELFSWYGSRLLESPDYFVRLRAGLRQ